MDTDVLAYILVVTWSGVDYAAVIIVRAVVDGLVLVAAFAR